MHPVLKNNLYFVKEQIGMFKASNNFDIYSPDSNELLIECREIEMGFFTKFLRFTDYKRMTPFHIVLKDKNGGTVMT